VKGNFGEGNFGAGLLFSTLVQGYFFLPALVCQLWCASFGAGLLFSFLPGAIIHPVKSGQASHFAL
jgi:hypothetical protein